jgi:hypothetical protein
MESKTLFDSFLFVFLKFEEFMMDFTNILNKAKDSFKVAEIDISNETVVQDIQKQFKEAFALSLRIYKGLEGLAEPYEKLGEISEEEIKKSKKPFKIKASMQISNLIQSFEDNYGINIEIGDKEDTHVIPENVTLGQAARSEYPKDSLIDEKLKNDLIELIISKRGFRILPPVFSVLMKKEEYSKAELTSSMPPYSGSPQETNFNKFNEAINKKEFSFATKIFNKKGPEIFSLKPEYVKYIAQVNYEVRKKLYALANSVGNYDIKTLKGKFKDDLNDDGNVSARLIVFLILLLQNNKPIMRDDIKKAFVEHGVSDNEGIAGTHLSNVSQYLTRPDNDHVRQVIGWNETGLNQLKEGYFIKKEEFKIMLKELLTEMNNQ